MRLTYKDDRVAGGYNAVYCDEFACVGKLGQLEDIEEELGVDLVTLFKALKKGIYCKGINVYGYRNKKFKNPIHREVELDIFNKTLYEVSDISFTPIYPVKLKDYGKTWALTKEELL